MNLRKLPFGLQPFDGYGGLLDSIFLDKKNVQAGIDAEQKNAALTAKKAVARGVTPESMTAPYVWGAEIQRGPMVRYTTDSKTSVAGGFKEGAADGARSMRQGAGNAINSIIGTVGSIIPWQVWLALGVGAFAYFNPTKARHILRRR